LRALDVALRATNFLLPTANGGFSAAQFGGKFWDLQHRQRLPLFHMIANVHSHGLDISGNFGMYVHFLERFERACNGQRVSNVAALHAGDGCRNAA